jgi:RND family efflux transporter MFP subunit
MNDDRRFRKSLPLAFAAVLLTGACAKSGHEAHDELPAVPLTVWTAKTELFLEYEPLVAGRESRMAAHLTALETFQPLTEGVVTLRLRMESGEVVTGEAKEAARAGIFRPNVTPAKAGKCRLEVEVRASNLTDRLDGGACQVFADEAAARAAAAGEEEAAGAQIAFLKEQQWKTDFATAPAVERDAQATVEASGSLVPVAGRGARLSAPASGRVAFGDTAPVPGAAVRKGQLLGSISPRLAAGSDRPGLEAEMRATEAERVAADSQLARAERLLAAEAISKRALEDAQAGAAVARARASAAAARVAQYDASAGSGSGSGLAGRFEIRSPLDGTLVSVEAAPGEMVEEGQALFRVVDARRVWLEARANEADLSRLEGTKSAWFTVEGDAALYDAGRLVSFGRVVDPATRTVPVLFEVASADGRLRVGQAARVRLATGPSVRALTIPDSAVLDDGGKPVAFVHVSGEAFERRVLTLGAPGKGWVQVLAGLAPGERVVTKGAYEIKLAAASGSIPSSGHVH